MHIIIYQRGYFTGLRYCLESIHLHSPNCPIHVIGSEIPDFTDFKDEFDYNFRVPEFEKMYEHHSPNKFSFELLCLRRWIVINNYVKYHNINQFFVCDSDVLIMDNLDTVSELFKPSDFTYPFITAFFFNASCLDKFVDFIFQYYRIPKSKFRDDSELKVKQGKIVGVSDMTLVDEFSKEFNFVRSYGDPLQVRLDGNLGFAENFCQQNGYKLIQFMFGQPYAKTLDGRLIRFATLHCWGIAKTRMSWYLNQSIKTMIF